MGLWGYGMIYSGCRAQRNQITCIHQSARHQEFMEPTLNTKRKIGFLKHLSDDSTRIFADFEIRSHAWKDEKQTLGQPYTAICPHYLIT